MVSEIPFGGPLLPASLLCSTGHTLDYHDAFSNKISKNSSKANWLELPTDSPKYPQIRNRLLVDPIPFVTIRDIGTQLVSVFVLTS